MATSTSSTAPASSRCRRAYQKVVNQAEQLLELATDSDDRLIRRSDKTSAWSVGQHLDHMANANQAMAAAVTKILSPEPIETRSGPTFLGRAVLLGGWIPRGAGKAPDFTTPAADSPAQIRSNVRASLQVVSSLGEALPEIGRSKARLDHFAFGGLTPMQWLRTMDVHTRHHLKIIRDIERATD
jgi:hypothetical protein